MATPNSFVLTSDLLSPGPSTDATLPRDCTFSKSDWRALAQFWYPVAFSREITDKPYAARLLDERVVLYRLTDKSIAALATSAITVVFP
jgi:hypothetical protein